MRLLEDVEVLFLFLPSDTKQDQDLQVRNRVEILYVRVRIKSIIVYENRE